MIKGVFVPLLRLTVSPPAVIPQSYCDVHLLRCPWISWPLTQALRSWNSTTEFIQTLRANTFGNLMTIVWWWSTWHPRELVLIGCNVPKKSSEIPLRIMITIPTWARLLQNSALAKKQLGFYSFSVLLWTLFFNGF